MKEKNHQELEQTTSQNSPRLLALIIGGDRSFQEGVTALLTTMPYILSILIAEESKVAVRMLHTHNPDLVLLNLTYMIEEQDELISELQHINSDPNIILFSESENPALLMHDINSYSVLPTGFTPGQLIQSVEKIILRRK